MTWETDKSPDIVDDDDSVMYNNNGVSKDFFELKQYDWRQFAIMLAQIIEGSDDEYHKCPPVFSEDVCGKELQISFSHGTKPREECLKWKKERTLDDMF